jgi:archaellum component FlaC
MKNIETLNQEIVKLEEQKTNFLNLEQDLKDTRSNIYVREQQALSDSLLPFFEGFQYGVSIEVLRESIYFKTDHPDYNYKKELFSIYLRERYSEEGKKYNGVDLSYYTTSTKGENTWELKRLQLLGRVAEILEDQQGLIVDTANEVASKFKEEFNDVYGKMGVVGNSIRDLNNQIREIQKQIKKIELFGEGIQFEKSRCITLKHNYEPRVVSLKLIEVSKSGKKATAVFEWEKGRESREEGVNVEKIIYQVI